MVTTIFMQLAVFPIILSMCCIQNLRHVLVSFNYVGWKACISYMCSNNVSFLSSVVLIFFTMLIAVIIFTIVTPKQVSPTECIRTMKYWSNYVSSLWKCLNGPVPKSPGMQNIYDWIADMKLQAKPRKLRKWVKEKLLLNNLISRHVGNSITQCTQEVD